MANTLRKTTASLFSGRGGLIKSSRDRSKYHSVNQLARQWGGELSPGALETVVPLIAATAKTAAALHAQWAGSTVSIGGCNMAGAARFAVSIYPQRSAELAAPPTWELLFAFAVINADLLLLPDHALGTWLDRLRNQHVLDVVVCPSSLSEAIELGRRYCQKAIFDLGSAKVIDLPSKMAAPQEQFNSEAG